MARFAEVGELKNWQLDYVVATQVCDYTAEMTISFDRIVELRYLAVGRDKFAFTPSSTWADGGPLIQSFGLSVSQDPVGMWTCTSEYGISHQDSSPLVAAMRTLIVMKATPPYQIPSYY